MARSDDNDVVSMATERTPLLANNENAPAADPLASGLATLQNSRPATPAQDSSSNTQNEEDDDRPLPGWQIAVLCYARLIEPMTFFSIFPYVNQMAQENGNLAAADVGFYSGLIESLFSLTQASVMILWGKASDRIGRKPVLVFSIIGVSIATSIFGLAKTLEQMILFRCIAGVFAGTIVTIRTMLSEVSTKKTQAIAFSWFAFSGNLGIFLGPLIGGGLADPARQYPKFFGKVQFFLEYPYALSSFVVSVIGLSAAVVTALFVKETLDKGDSTTEDGVVKPKDESLTIMELIKSPGVFMVLCVYCWVGLLAVAYTALFPVYLFTPVALGGFGLVPYQISIFITITGAAQAMWLLLIFPPLQHRFGTNAIIRGCAVVYPFCFAVMPVGNILLRNGAVTAFWVITPVFYILFSGVAMSFTAVQLAVNNVAPNPRVLGTLNSLALMSVSVVRSFTPAVASSLFALGARTQWLWGYAIWVLMVLLAAWFTVISRWLPPEKGKEKAVHGGPPEQEPLLRSRDPEDDETVLR
ncbi:hypothetical protein N0V93_001289 [Gnomoniopsis smithogilvyi]|uniref:Major facilitator superfamily (MFS) profile domain-containing protein n=1 Tax=Gnomoniopsis smithogilvyi TaxID=1191159 RepID=A0A9W8Z3F5_9PEZI|nr:hypothetical protein N0V93_001289 [Gnomoniopsis smithogilvyi]